MTVKIMLCKILRIQDSLSLIPSLLMDSMNQQTFTEYPLCVKYSLECFLVSKSDRTPALTALTS